MDAREKSSSGKRLIDANALKERAIRMVAVNSLGNKQHCYFKAVGTDEIDKAPTVDAVEMVHGYWYEHYGIAICSHCQSMFDYDLKMLQVPSTWKMPNYCPNCGAKMDLEVTNDA